MRARRIAITALVCVGLVAPVLAMGLPSDEESVVVGKELFAREWVVNDPRTRGGDGLGPVFNAVSCVACHFVGGVGGSGPVSKNAEIVSASVRLMPSEDITTVPRDSLISVHPAFATASSIVLHRGGSQPGYSDWKKGFSTIPVLVVSNSR
jgi:hypothetical protein